MLSFSLQVDNHSVLLFFPLYLFLNYVSSCRSIWINSFFFLGPQNQMLFEIFSFRNHIKCTCLAYHSLKWQYAKNFFHIYRSPLTYGIAYHHLRNIVVVRIGDIKYKVLVSQFALTRENVQVRKAGIKKHLFICGQEKV